MKRTIFLIALIVLITVSGYSQDNLQTVATVNLIRTESITVRQLRTEVERMEQAAGRKLNQSERLQVLDVMINERLALQAAERDRITVSENEVNQQIQQLRNVLAQQLGRQPTDAEFNRAIREESGLELPAFREQLRKQLVTQKYLMFKKETLINSIKVPTEEEIRAQFNLVRAQFVQPEMVRFTGIQVPFGPDAASRRRAKELADQLISEIGSSPARFDAVVARGQTPNSNYQAGDGGYIPRNMEAQARLGADFVNTAFSLRQGDVSRVIESTTGYLIIKVTENHEMKNLGLDDVITGTRMTVRDQIGNVMLQERQQTILAQASQELVTELRSNGRTFQVFERHLNW
jgi:parvulin-like peptidyl-prolyl isomerase